MTDEQTQATLQDTPDPALINEQVRAQAMANMAGQTLGQITQAAMQLLTTATCNNPRLCLAVANELSLIYAEALRRGLMVNQATEKADEAPAPEAANG
jgi:hypothetical protein